MRQILLFSVLLTASEAVFLKSVTNSIITAFPCKNSNDFTVKFEPGFRLNDQNQYYFYVDKIFSKDGNVKAVFSSEVLSRYVVTTRNGEYLRRTLPKGHTFSLRFPISQVGFGFVVKGTEPGVVPYLLSFSSNGFEYCNEPRTGFLDQYVSKSTFTNSFDCGRRLSERTVVSGDLTKPGDWPWHAAIYRLRNSVNKYSCGGTLISKNFVLSVAHCVTIRDAVPPNEIFSAVLGKNKLTEHEPGSQQIAVSDIFIHKNFDYVRIINDISLLKLKGKVIFNDLIRPACLWHSSDLKKFPNVNISGTVVGWGYDNDNKPSEILQQVTLPMVSEMDCMKSNSRFVDMLNGNNFCAGARDGTAPCNGDSGGAFQVFIPDEEQDDNQTTTGSWHVRGVLSSALSKGERICDPQQYVVSTDVEKFRDWIVAYLED